MTGGSKFIDQIQVTLKGQDLLDVYINVYDNSLSKKWLDALNTLLAGNYHLEKNYCWIGWTESERNCDYICQQINQSINHINNAGIGYEIKTDSFEPSNVIAQDLDINHARLNQLHKWFEDLQGWSGQISQHYSVADTTTRWHIRQLNLLCHELESLILSLRKDQQAPEWKRPSQLMCWLQAPRFLLDEQDYDLFGVETINRQMGGVYLGVNKAVGKHHWEVFNDEGGHSRIDQLTTSALRPQTEAAGDFDIEWARDPGAYPWQIKKLQEFRQWLMDNGFDPNDKFLTIGHPKVAQVDLEASFGTNDYRMVWQMLEKHMNVIQIKTSTATASYNYNWSDQNYAQLQIDILSR